VLSGDDVALKIQADVYRFSSLTAVPRQITNVESLMGLSCQVTGEIEYFTGGRRSPAKTVSGTISRFSQIDVTWLYLNVVMQKKNPCAGGSAGFHLSTVFGPLRSVVYRFTL
jgi:uncharacterized protein YchJ